MARAARAAAVFPTPTFPGDDSEGAFADGPADPGGGLAVGVVAVQHPGGQVGAERVPGETPMFLPALNHRCSSRGAAAVAATVMWASRSVSAPG